MSIIEFQFIFQVNQHSVNLVDVVSTFEMIHGTCSNRKCKKWYDIQHLSGYSVICFNIYVYIFRYGISISVPNDVSGTTANEISEAKSCKLQSSKR